MVLILRSDVMGFVKAMIDFGSLDVRCEKSINVYFKN